MKYKITTLLVLVVAVLPVAVFASPVIRSGESVAVGQGQVVEGDFYGAGGSVTVSGEVQGDVYVAGGTVTVNAPVGTDLVAAGGVVQVHSPVGDDLRIAGGEAIVGSAVNGDVVVFGGVLHVLSTADIKGDILFFGGELVVEGPVEGSIFGFSKSTRIDASVGGDITIRADEKLTLGDRAEVLGNIAYTGSNDIERAQNAVVVGDIQTEKVAGTGGIPFGFIFTSLIATLFAALTFFLIFRRQFEEVVERSRTAYGVQGLIGLAVFVGMPFVSVILILSVLGSLIGIFLLAVYIALLVASWIVLAGLIGSFIMRFFDRSHQTLSILSIGVGVLALELLMLIPFLGTLAVFAGVVIVLGGIALRIYRAIS